MTSSERVGDDPPADLLAYDSTAGRLVLATVILGSAVAMLTATVVNIALPTLAVDLDASSAGQTWVINGYTLTLAALILVGGSLGDRLGRRRVYRIGVAWFAIASLLCALAWNVESLIVFRLLQGVGGALLTPGSLAIIQASFRKDDRGRSIGAWSGLGGIAAAIGPLVGGVLVEASWRWVFVINVPIAGAVLVLSRWVPESCDRVSVQGRLDGTGAVLTAVTLGGATYALIEGPNAGFSMIDAAAGAVAVVAAVALIIHERRTEHPLVPIELFADRTFAVANGLTFVVYGGMGVLFFLLAIQLQVTAGWTPLGSGTAMLPVTALMLVLSPRMGALADRIGPRIPLTVGPLVIAVGMLLLTRVGSDASFVGDVLPGVVVFGLGLSLIVAPVTSTALGAAPDSRAGAASGVNNAVARTGGLLAVAAVPGLVGLTGDALGDPAQLGPGFDDAMRWSAAMVAAAGLGTFVLLPRDVVEPAQVHSQACPVDGPASSVAT